MERLFVLPFDHRSTFVRDLLKDTYPPKAKVANQVKTLKGIVFEGFLQARRQSKNPSELAILIDEEFGDGIIKTAKKTGIKFAVSVEKSGQAIFTFEYGRSFGTHLKKIRPDFAKALVHYDTTKHEDNQIQLKRLKELSDFCQKQKLGLMMELLTAGPGGKVKQIETVMKEMLAAGIRPTLWKVEGLDRANDWRRLRQLTKMPIIVLGRGESKKFVSNWIALAAKSGQTNGFAIGRTIFYRALEDYLKKKIDRETAVKTIAKNYLNFLALWQKSS